MPRKSRAQIAVEAMKTKIEDAFVAAANRAFESVIRAYRFHPDPVTRWYVVQEAREQYAGAWYMALTLDLDPPMPGEWIKWAEAAAEEIVAADRRRAEVNHAAP